MPVISFANPKGGTGKSTSALILALELAHRGGKVALVDCDPNQTTAGWAAARDVNGDKTPFICLLYTSPSPRDATLSRMPSSA